MRMFGHIICSILKIHNPTFNVSQTKRFFVITEEPENAFGDRVGYQPKDISKDWIFSGPDPSNPSIFVYTHKRAPEIKLRVKAADVIDKFTDVKPQDL